MPRAALRARAAEWSSGRRILRQAQSARGMSHMPAGWARPPKCTVTPLYVDERTTHQAPRSATPLLRVPRFSLSLLPLPPRASTPPALPRCQSASHLFCYAPPQILDDLLTLRSRDHTPTPPAGATPGSSFPCRSSVTPAAYLPLN